MWPDPAIPASTLVQVLDLCAVFVFALSGALAGLRHRFDLFGVLVLAFTAANVGGITRDLLIGAVPPPGIADWRYLVVPVAAGLVTFRRGAFIDRLRSPVLILDAGGLALFSVSGALKALEFGLGAAAAVLLGMLTGIGGGMARDVLAGEPPVVLRRDIYAVAALAGAAVVVGGRAIGLPSALVGIAGALLCFGLRLIAIRRRWQLPVTAPEAAE